MNLRGKTSRKEGLGVSNNIRCESSAQTRTATSECKTGTYTPKRKDEHTEPFRTVLLNVMRKDVAKYGKKT